MLRRDQRTATRRKAEGTLTKVKGGASFGALASQLSEDPGSRADSGFLPPEPARTVRSGVRQCRAGRWSRAR